jgi:hypothetical protein
VGCSAKEVVVSDDRITSVFPPGGSGLTPGERREGITSSTPPASEPLDRQGEEKARSAFVAWEKLRVAFNAVLAAVVLLSAGSALSEETFWVFLLQGTLLANLCFCLGPVAEGYLTLAGSGRQSARWVVFSLGVMAGCLLAFLAVFSWQMRGFD